MSDIVAIQSFLAGFVCNDIHLVAIKPDVRGAIGHDFRDDFLSASEWAKRQNAEGKNVYWTVNRTKPGIDRKTSKADIVGVRFAHVDIDPPKEGGVLDKDAMVTNLRSLAYPPSKIVDSGNGIQAFWQLDSDCRNYNSLEAINRSIADRFGGDKCHNIDRVLRLPGTINWPDSIKRAKGCVPVLSSVVAGDEDVLYDPEQLRAAFPCRPLSFQLAVAAVPATFQLTTADELGLAQNARLRKLIDNPKGEDRSRDAFACAKEMNRLKYERSVILGVLMNRANAVSEHILCQPDSLRQAQRCADRALPTEAIKMRSAARLAETSNSKIHSSEARTNIKVVGGDIHILATKGEEALIAAGAPLYARGRIVIPVVETLITSRGHEISMARLKVVDTATLVDRLSRVVGFTKFDSRSRSEVPIDPPNKVADTILSRAGEWKFATIAGVITTPTLRPDGSVLSKPGYDSVTRLLLVAPPVLPEMSDTPTKQDALRALTLLDSLLDGFPFVDQPSRSVALAAMLSTVARGAMDVVPMTAVSGPVRGSGKSYLIDVLSAITIGDRAPVFNPTSEVELEKKLVAASLAGDAIIAIDNVSIPLTGDFLCQLVERPVLAVRPLGTSNRVIVTNRTSFFASGNNLQVVNDMTRRTLMITLDPNMERPEFRTFESKPFNKVLENRGEYIAACLTICRAYCVAGYPNKLSPLASFDQWSDVVRSALVWLGRADPVETMNAVCTEDPVRAQLSCLLSAWFKVLGAGFHTTRGIKQVSEMCDGNGINESPELAAALGDIASDMQRAVCTKRFGKFLSQNKGRVVDGLKLVAGRDSHAKQCTWSVVEV
jgi:putative DNA primase/helicase